MQILLLGPRKTWKKKAVTSGTIVSSLASAVFVLPGASEAGDYTINAIYNPSANYLGAADATQFLTVAPAPSVSVSADSTLICSGGSVLLSATATGGTGSYASYQWFRDGSPLADLTSSMYSVDMPGLYTVRVTDSSDAVSAWSSGTAVTAAVPVDPTAWWRTEGNTNDSVGSVHGTLMNGAKTMYWWIFWSSSDSGRGAAQ